MSQRYLIVNADDFGQSAGINEGVIEAHERGIVTSASLMVRWPAAAAAAAYAHARRDFSLGLHVDLGEWAYRNAMWVPVYHVVETDDPAAVAAEVARQLDTFRRLTGADPTHFDSHQHVHRREPVRAALQTVADRLGVPLRGCIERVRYCGSFYGQSGRGEPYPQGIALERLLETLTNLPAGCTELGCHPGLIDDVDSMYRAERAVEVQMLCDPRVRAALAAGHIQLCSFHTIAGHLRSRWAIESVNSPVPRTPASGPT